MKELEANQLGFFNRLKDAFGTAFTGQQNILNALTARFTPILEAGPNQTGFSPAEEAAIRSSSSDAVTKGYQSAAEAARASSAAAGGGNVSVPSGAGEQIQAAVAESGAQELAKEQQQITEADYATGRQNFEKAAGEMNTIAAEENPTGFAGAANTAGSDTAQTEEQLAQEENAWMAPVFGAIGGVGGALAGRSWGGGGG